MAKQYLHYIQLNMHKTWLTFMRTSSVNQFQKADKGKGNANLIFRLGVWMAMDLRLMEGVLVTLFSLALSSHFHVTLWFFCAWNVTIFSCCWEDMNLLYLQLIQSLLLLQSTAYFESIMLPMCSMWRLLCSLQKPNKNDSLLEIHLPRGIFG